ncbi:hypothetical protein CTAYLR_000343 [Chrysophaeum taylorii]|uniref:DM10 domain-containing protein n=1 Tax=Chrysophaeum taylorii TaxID=2483200 RepID=A0AAD7XJV0_9STRA|nr:hypothetical protein CTAYLR_000343 [Chrysophaeum taylorii]
MEAYDLSSGIGGLRVCGGRRKIHYGGTSIGNPLNLSFGRRPASAGARRRPKGDDESLEKAKPLSRPVSATSLCSNNNNHPETLSFYAYFIESILEHTNKSVPYRNRRVRKCILTFYTSDGTLAVDEPRTKNSGYVQGKLLKRSQVRKPNGDKYGVDDLAVGAEIDVFGRTFVVVDADTRTRTIYEQEFGRPLGPALDYPDDGFEAERARMEISKKYASSSSSSSSRPSSAPALRRKMAAGMKEEKSEVLRFFCAYQDDRPDGDRRSYTLHYFLSDETIEIKEVPTEGVQRFPNLLRRSRLPRNVEATPENPLTDACQPTFVTWKDLRCGSTITAWGRPLLLLSCDRRTEAWFEARGVTQQPLQIARDDAEAFPQTLPPFNGFGAENDLYAMGLSLQPAVINNTQEDYRRFIQADNKVLRFECCLAGETTMYDNGRAFVINYYLGDDTIMVYEPPVRNSGFTGGVFLTRMRYKKHIPDQRSLQKRGMGSVLSRWLRPADFYEGAEVAFEAPATGRLLQTFKVRRADDYTKRVERENHLTIGSRMAIIMEQLAERLCAARIQVRSNFKALDAANERYLPDHVFEAELGRMDDEAVARGNCGNLASLDHEMLDEICWHFAKNTNQNRDGVVRVRYDEFVDALVLAAPMPQLPELKSSSTTNVTHKSLEQALLAPLRHQMKDVAANSGLLRASFHSEDLGNAGTVDADGWYRVLRKHKLHGVLSRDEADQLKQRYSNPSELHAGVEYERLCDKVFEGDFEDYMAALLMVLPERGDLSSVDLNQYRKHLIGGNAIPTVRNYLDKVNGAVRECGGDVQRKLNNTIRAFSSAFGRNHRKKMLRKHLMAFDVSNTGSCSRAEFGDSIKRIIADGYCEFDLRDHALIIGYLFPRAWTRQPYDDLLEVLVARDVKGVVRMHDAAMSQQEDPRFHFR